MNRRSYWHHVLTNVMHNHLVFYPTPINFNYFYGFGVLAAMCLGIQIITGIFLAMHYVPQIDLAFESIEHIMRDVNNGWLIRYIHANGASMFFLTVYIHMFRGLYYGSYVFPRQHLWMSGAAIFIVMTATAFMGYVLPWGQMSFWGATVITNLFSAIPIVGGSIVKLLWGGFSVDNATLNRMFSLHYLLPFVIAGLVGVHIILLHYSGSNNPLGTNAGSTVDKIPFYPYFYVKDLFGFLLFGILFSGFVFFYPNTLGHPDNYIQANPLSTPAHIVPEWYLLPFYAILRSIPDKLGGVVCMGLALITLFILPVISRPDIRSATFRPIFKLLFWVIVANCCLLGWLGQKVVEPPFVLLGRIATVMYFVSFFILIPATEYIEFKLLKNYNNN